jgi:RNA polymerase sigma-70 factor, ECF subfamily
VSEQTSNDVEIVAQLRQGDKGALVRLYDEYSGLVYGVARRILRDGTAAEDVVQEVFLQLWRNPGAFDERRGRLAPWLAVIARHKALDVFRKLKFEVDSDEPPPEPAAAKSPEPEHSSADADKAKTLMAQLPAEQKKVLEMAYLDGLTHAEIATRTGEPLGTVKSRIRLGLLFLRKEMAP